MTPPRRQVLHVPGLRAQRGGAQASLTWCRGVSESGLGFEAFLVREGERCLHLPRECRPFSEPFRGKPGCLPSSLRLLVCPSLKLAFFPPSSFLFVEFVPRFYILTVVVGGIP